MADAYGDTAYMSYRLGSDNIHGNWHDLEWNHLEQRPDGRFIAHMHKIPARPQTMNSATIHVVLALVEYLRHRSAVVGEAFGPQVVALAERAFVLDELHEQWLVQHPDRR